jgi:arylsulfatase A-like enzyme
MKNELLPGLDRAFAGLISDLDGRGMLDDTLVLCLSEHGRTPKLQNVNGGGRDHWSQCYSGLMTGGGVTRGKVVGKSDKIGGTVAERPISPKDVLATVYHLLGIDHETTLTDRTGKPVPLVADASVIPEVLA